MSECKHGLKSGCAYCNAPAPPPPPVRRPGQRTRAKPTKLSEKMNDRMTALRQRLKQIRGS